MKSARPPEKAAPPPKQYTYVNKTKKLAKLGDKEGGKKKRKEKEDKAELCCCAGNDIQNTTTAPSPQKETERSATAKHGMKTPSEQPSSQPAIHPARTSPPPPLTLHRSRVQYHARQHPGTWASRLSVSRAAEEEDQDHDEEDMHPSQWMSQWAPPPRLDDEPKECVAHGRASPPPPCSQSIRSASTPFVLPVVVVVCLSFLSLALDGAAKRAPERKPRLG